MDTPETPRQCGSQESTCQCRRHGLDPWVGRSPRAENGNPLQYCCLENSVDRGAWWATVHGVPKSRTQLSIHTHPHLKPEVVLHIFWQTPWSVLRYKMKMMKFPPVKSAVMHEDHCFLYTICVSINDVSFFFPTQLSCNNNLKRFVTSTLQMKWSVER